MKKSFLLFLVFSFTSISAQPFSGIPETNAGSPSSYCNTNGYFSPPSQTTPDPSNPLYYSKTTVTFFGDSRIDFANAIPKGYNPALYYLPAISNGNYPGKEFSLGLFYGVSSLDFYLGTDSSWNIQNFGHGGDDSAAMLGHLNTCLTNANYKIAPNVAFEIGGNDYLQNLLMLVLMPWHSQEYVNRSLNNIERAITRFYKIRKNALIIGNYPAIGWSAQRGLPNDNGFAFKSFNFKYQAILQSYSITDMTNFKSTLSEMKPILSNTLMAYGAVTAFTDLLTGAVIAGVGYILNPSQGNTCFGSEIPTNGPVPAYFCWLAANQAALGTFPSFLMGIQESEYSEIQTRRKPYFQAQGLTLEYLRLWEAFVHPATLEPWVANDALMGDLVHPNAIGLTVWGYHVSSKIKSLGWHLPKTPPVTPPPPPPTDNGGENTGRTEPGGLSEWDLILLCFLFGVCHL
ncbi:lipase [Leptospira santarosai]|uniref:LIC10707 family hydrolase n=1 Tax=Leptospira santarosai TaxID=28183 RepID=UPI0024AEDCCE|nr:lipase [Leptospira santarosai]MDI7230087.1 lipase [Leptospira santarosai]